MDKDKIDDIIKNINISVANSVYMMCVTEYVIETLLDIKREGINKLGN